MHYTVTFEQANAHLFDVKFRIDFPLKKGQKFSFPNWIPGSYMIRDFSRNIISLSANDLTNNNPIKLEKLTKSSWLLTQDVEILEINYQVYAWDLSVRSAHLDQRHGFFNGSSLFLAAVGFEEKPHQLLLEPSPHAIKSNWQVATAMQIKSADDNGFGLYVSENYDEFIDHPFEMANLISVDFQVFGIAHKMVFTEAPERVDWQRIAKDVAKICETEIQFFGGKPPPFESYVFMTFVQKKGFGGLEHRASTALHCSYEDLPLIGEDKTKINSDYRTFLSLCCHEYFHSWNIKRIKPSRFIPMDLSQEIYTELLWFFEGITSYYDELLLARSQVIGVTDYLDMLAQTITRVMRSKGRHKQTVTDSSFDAWNKFYKQDENAVNSIVSYYTKGALVAFCLDFEIRKLTSQKKSLDDLMRIIWQQHGMTEIGVDEKQIKQITEILVGQSMDDFFNQALYSTEDLNIESLFEQLDICYQLKPQRFKNEKGGFIEKFQEDKPVAFLGITHQSNDLGVMVNTVEENSSAAVAGISNGDIIIAIDTLRVTSNELDKVIVKIPLDSEILISYFRRDRLYHCKCTLKSGDATTCYLSLKSKKPSQPLLDWIVNPK